MFSSQAMRKEDAKEHLPDGATLRLIVLLNTLLNSAGSLLRLASSASFSSFCKSSIDNVGSPRDEAKLLPLLPTFRNEAPDRGVPGIERPGRVGVFMPLPPLLLLLPPSSSCSGWYCLRSVLPRLAIDVERCTSASTGEGGGEPGEAGSTVEAELKPSAPSPFAALEAWS